MKSLLNNFGANLVKDSVTLLGTEDSTSTSTGTLICQGGVGVSKSVFVGGNVNTSNLKLTATVPNIEVGGTSRLTFGLNSTNFGSYAPLLVQNTLDVGSSPVAASITTSGGINIGKSLNVAGTTESTSTTTGTIICSGGLGVAKNIYVGGALQTNRLGVTDNVAIGALGDRNTAIDLLIHSPLNPGSSRLQFTDEATGTTTDSGFLIMKNTAGNALITNLVTGGSMYIGVKDFDAFEINSSGIINCPVTTDSTSTSNGAVTIKGGMGITKRLNVGSLQVASGGLVNLGRTTVGQLTSNATAVTINSSSGKIVTFGPLAALGDYRIFVSNNVVSTGSVILVSIGQQANYFVDAGTQPVLYVNDIQNGYFTIQLVNAANVAGTNKLVIHFLVC